MRMSSKLFSAIDGTCAMAKDGNCQFRAMSYGLHGSDVYHADVRRCVVSELRRNWDRYEPFVTQCKSYVERMSLPGTYGDNVTLKAFCNAFQHGVVVLNERGTVSALRPDDCSDMDARDYITIVYNPSMTHYDGLRPYNVHPTRHLLNRMQDNASLNIQINHVVV